jgi:hypothetical protein
MYQYQDRLKKLSSREINTEEEKKKSQKIFKNPGLKRSTRETLTVRAKSQCPAHLHRFLPRQHLLPPRSTSAGSEYTLAIQTASYQEIWVKIHHCAGNDAEGGNMGPTIAHVLQEMTKWLRK